MADSQVPSGSGPWGGLVNIYDSSNGPTDVGTYYAAVQGSGSYVEQTVSVTAGSAYDIHFMAAERPGVSTVVLSPPRLDFEGFL